MVELRSHHRSAGDPWVWQGEQQQQRACHCALEEAMRRPRLLKAAENAGYHILTKPNVSDTGPHYLCDLFLHKRDNVLALMVKVWRPRLLAAAATSGGSGVTLRAGLRALVAALPALVRT